MPKQTVSPIKIVNNKIVAKQNGNSNNVNKRSLPSSPSSPLQSPPIINPKKTKLFFTPNRFAALSADDNDIADKNDIEVDVHAETPNEGQQNTTNISPKIILPPPIFIKGVHDYIGLPNRSHRS